MITNNTEFPSFEEFAELMANDPDYLENMLMDIFKPVECRICKLIKLFTSKVIGKKVEDHTAEDIDTLSDMIADPDISNLVLRMKFVEAIAEVLGEETPSLQTTFEIFILESAYPMIKDQQEIELIKAYFGLIEDLRK